MSKLTEKMAQHPEMTPVEITRVEVRKVAEPGLRAGLEAIVDLVELYGERVEAVITAGVDATARDLDRQLQEQNERILALENEVGSLALHSPKAAVEQAAAAGQDPIPPKE